MTIATPTDAAIARLEAQVAELRDQIDDLSRDVFSPKEIARRIRIDHAEVYAACASGALVAEVRPLSRGRTGYLITLDDARRWYARTRKTNQ